jgi:hypothetical protein
VISTVDPDARHGHKTSARSFDGYKEGVENFVYEPLGGSDRQSSRKLDRELMQRS